MSAESKQARLPRLLLLVGLAGAAAGAAWYYGLGPFRPADPGGRLVLSGNIEAHQSVLAFKGVQSNIVELPLEEGQWVEAGTVLARLENADYRQQVAIDEAALRVQEQQLEAAHQNVEAARKTVQRGEAEVAQKSLEFSRKQRLWQQRSTSAEDRDLAESALKQSRAALERDEALLRVADENVKVAGTNIRLAGEKLELSKITLGHTILRAPFAGVVLVRQAEPGEVMLPGTPVATLADLDHVWMRAYVNEPDIGRIRLGQAVDVRGDSFPDKRYRGRISFISSKAEFTPKSVETHAERVTLVYRIKIALENPGHELKPGMPVDATIDAQAAGAHD